MADIQKEMKVRRRVEGIFNKRQEDFTDLRDFGDYEEEKEDIIFNLSQGIDVEAMESKISAYQKQNYDAILRNEARKAESKRKEVEEQKPQAQTSEPNVAAGEGAAPPAGKSGWQVPSLEQPSLPPVPVTVCGEAGQTAGSSNDASTAGKGEDRELMGLVSGWHPDMPKRRALEEAYSTLFVS